MEPVQEFDDIKFRCLLIFAIHENTYLTANNERKLFQKRKAAFVDFNPCESPLNRFLEILLLSLSTMSCLSGKHTDW